MGGRFSLKHHRPRPGDAVKFRLGFLARALYPVCRVVFGPGPAPGLSVFLSDVLLYGLVLFVCFRFFSFSFSGQRLRPDLAPGVAAVADYRSSVTGLSAGPAGGLSVGGPPAGGPPAGGPACRVFCVYDVDCDLLRALNPHCEVEVGP